jgi:hypothetical protein
MTYKIFFYNKLLFTHGKCNTRCLEKKNHDLKKVHSIIFTAKNFKMAALS